jgi:hypothetical protein
MDGYIGSVKGFLRQLDVSGTVFYQEKKLDGKENFRALTKDRRLGRR